MLPKRRPHSEWEEGERLQGIGGSGQSETGMAPGRGRGTCEEPGRPPSWHTVFLRGESAAGSEDAAKVQKSEVGQETRELPKDTQSRR